MQYSVPKTFPPTISETNNANCVLLLFLLRKSISKNKQKHHNQNATFPQMFMQLFNFSGKGKLNCFPWKCGKHSHTHTASVGDAHFAYHRGGEISKCHLTLQQFSGHNFPGISLRSAASRGRTFSRKPQADCNVCTEKKNDFYLRFSIKFNI